MLQLHPESWEAEHHGSRHTGAKPQGERAADEEHRSEHAHCGGLHCFHVCGDDAQVAAGDKEHGACGQADARDEHGVQVGRKAGTDTMRRTQRG